MLQEFILWVYILLAFQDIIIAEEALTRVNSPSKL